jgi:ATP-binding cassette subfamily F protein 3
MISISLSNNTLVLGARIIFKDLYWEIQDNQKIGLIGPNGAGKSSLLKLITGEYTPEPGGSVVFAKGVRVGYLPQQPELDLTLTALDSALQGNPRVAEISAALTEIEQKLEDPAVYEDGKKLGRVIDEQQRLLDEFETLGGESYPQIVAQMLVGLGLAKSEFEKPLSVLSGGQKKLIGLARLLLAKPPVLLLDEPDNHLDLPGKTYLERMIRDYPGAVVIVSHDRYLLDAAVTHIAEIEDGRLVTFEGDYSSYMLDKEDRLLRQQRLYSVQQREIHRMETSIKRLALWGKLYDNEKFIRRAQSMQKRLEKMEKMEKPVIERRKMDLQLEGWRGSNKVLEFRKVSKAFGSTPLLQEINATLWHGERVGLIGPNGSGKSVILRMILGKEYPSSGEIILGPSVRIGYYAQEHETLDFNQTLIEVVRSTAPLSESSAVAYLLRYLFTYRQVTQKIGDLSGGERSRLQLALLVLSGANFLLLDEPTNNLDIASAEVLETALDDFIGTVLVISHDRYFLDEVVDRLMVIDEREVVEYAGNYADYLAIDKEKSPGSSASGS